MSERFTGGPPITCCMMCGVNRVDKDCFYPAVVSGIKCVVPCCQDCLDKRPTTVEAPTQHTILRTINP